MSEAKLPKVVVEQTEPAEAPNADDVALTKVIVEDEAAQDEDAEELVADGVMTDEGALEEDEQESVAAEETEDAAEETAPEVEESVEETVAREEPAASAEPEPVYRTVDDEFDPEKELALFRARVEQQMGIKVEPEKPEEPAAPVQPEPIAQPAAPAPAVEPAAPAEPEKPVAEPVKKPEPAPAKPEPRRESIEDLFGKPQQKAPEKSIEQRVAEDSAVKAPADNRITYHDVFRDEILAEQEGKKKEPKSHIGLKILAVILLILIVVEIAVIAIKWAAPESAAAIRLQDIFNSIYGALTSIGS